MTMKIRRPATVILAAAGALLWGAVVARGITLLSAAPPPAGEYGCLKLGYSYTSISGPAGPMLFPAYHPSVLGTLRLDGKGAYRSSYGTGRYAFNESSGAFAFVAGSLKGWPAVYEVNKGVPQLRLGAVKTSKVGSSVRIGEHVCRLRGGARADTGPRTGGGGAETRSAGAARPNGTLRGTLTFREEWGSNAIVDVDLATGKVASRFEGRDPHRAAGGETVFVNRVGALVIAGKNGVVAANVPVPQRDGRPAQPALSPAGDKVAYYADGNLSTDRRVVVVGRDGKRLAEFPAVTEPAWTPDGRLVVAGATGYQGDKPAIFLSDAGLTRLARIDPNLDDARAPAVSPDGRRIAFVYQGHFWIMNRDGTGLKQASFSGDGEERPTWSPDGTALAGATKTYGKVIIVSLSHGKIRDVKNAVGDTMQSSGRISWR